MANNKEKIHFSFLDLIISISLVLIGLFVIRYFIPLKITAIVVVISVALIVGLLRLLKIIG
jgi:hypothetical protein